MGWVGYGGGRKTDFSTPPFAEARTASVEMTVPVGGEENATAKATAQRCGWSSGLRFHPSRTAHPHLRRKNAPKMGHPRRQLDGEEDLVEGREQRTEEDSEDETAADEEKEKEAEHADPVVKLEST